jgi:hypothetical protein
MQVSVSSTQDICTQRKVVLLKYGTLIKFLLLQFWWPNFPVLVYFKVRGSFFYLPQHWKHRNSPFMDYVYGKNSITLYGNMISPHRWAAHKSQG